MKNLRFLKVSRTLIALALLAVFGLAGCESGGGGGGDNSGNNSSHINTTSGTASLATSVSTLDSSTASQIVTTDNSSVTFNGTPAATQTFKPGDIFIVQDTARKVESITVVNGQTVIMTVEPELHEVVSTIDVSGDVLLGEEHILKASVPSKVQVSVKKSKSRRAIDIGGSSTGNTFTYTFADYVIDGDGNQSTTYDQVSLNGDIVLDAPSITFLLKYGIISDKYAEINFKAGEELNLSLSSEELTFDKKLSIPLGSLVIPIAVTGGTVNVTVSLNLVFEANGKAKISASFSQNIVIDAGMTVTLGPATITSFNSSSYGWDFKQPQIEGEINTSAAVNPDVDLKFLQYTLAGINNSLAVKANAKANLALTNACYRVSADANVSSIAFIMLPKAAFNLDFSWSGVSGGLDLSMEKYPKELFTYTKELYDSGDICAVANEVPIANAGEDETSNVKASVFLDGTGSYDGDGTVVSYSWAQISGSSVALSDGNTATPYFIASSSAGALIFRLTVTDNKGATATDDVTVNVLPGETNSSPTADAGTDQTINGGTEVFLNGSLSWDSDGSIASYLWVQTGGTQVSLANTNTATPSFTAPSTASTLTFKLYVIDNKGATATDYVQVVVSASSTGTTPSITSVSPNPVTGSDSQLTITIKGTGFVNKPTVTLTWTGQSGYTVPAAQVTYVSSSQVQIAITTTTTPDNWTVQVTNPDGLSSNVQSFQVVAPAAAVFGTLVGTFNGVAANSNGSGVYVSNIYNSDTGINTGMKWQCVEYVNRYYYVIYGMDIRIAGQDAYQYYGDATARGLKAYPDAGATAPQVGDILSFGGGSTGLGHVAIIREVGANYVKVIQQNVTEDSRDADFSFGLTISGGTYTVSAANLGATYYTQGWLRNVVAVGTTPSAPTGASATAGDGQASITWNAVSDATSYNIYWSTTSGVTKTNGTKISNATSPYTHTGRTNGTTYYYVVTAVNSYGESIESSQASATTNGTGGVSYTW